MYRIALPKNHKSNDNHKLLYVTIVWFPCICPIHEGMFGRDNLIFFCRFSVYTPFSNSLCNNFSNMPIEYGQTMKIRSQKYSHLVSNKTNIGHFMIYNAEFKIAKDDRQRRRWKNVNKNGKRYTARVPVWLEVIFFYVFFVCRQRFAYINLTGDEYERRKGAKKIQEKKTIAG